MMEKIYLVYVTAANKNEAIKIGRELVKSRLAACINVFDGVSSIYWWKKKIEKSREAVLIVKTKKSLLKKLELKIKKLHSYSCPCILAIPVLGVNPDYAKWIIDETKHEDLP